MSFTPDQLRQAKGFIELLKYRPDILHHPDLSFFKEYLVSLGATIPEAKKPEPEAPQSKPAEKPTPKPEPVEVEPEVVEEPEEPEEPEEVDPDLWEADPEPTQSMGDEAKEVSDDDNSAAMGLFSQARQLVSQKDYEGAAAKFTEAIELNPTKAIFFASRADCFLKLKKPNAAIKDCDRALKLNPDQAKGYKVRGTAKRYLGQYEEAILDLFTGNKVDFDEETEAISKGIKERVEKLVAKRREKERKAEEAIRKRKIAEYERRKKAQEEARKRREEEEEAAGMEGGGLPPEYAAMFGDPEVQAALQDEEVARKLSEIMQNPAAAMKYASDPKIATLLRKLAPMFAGAGGPPPGGPAPGGHGGHGGHGHSHGPGGCPGGHGDEDFDVD